MTEKSPTYTIQGVEVNASPHSLPQREATEKWTFTCSHCSMPFFTLCFPFLLIMIPLELYSSIFQERNGILAWIHVPYFLAQEKIHNKHINNSYGEFKIYDAWLTICFPNYSLLVNWWVIRGILTLQATKSLFFGYSLLERHPVFTTSISHY